MTETWRVNISAPNWREAEPHVQLGNGSIVDLGTMNTIYRYFGWSTLIDSKSQVSLNEEKRSQQASSDHRSKSSKHRDRCSSEQYHSGRKTNPTRRISCTSNVDPIANSAREVCQNKINKSKNKKRFSSVDQINTFPSKQRGRIPATRFEDRLCKKLESNDDIKPRQSDSTDSSTNSSENKNVMACTTAAKTLVKEKKFDEATSDLSLQRIVQRKMKRNTKSDEPTRANDDTLSEFVSSLNQVQGMDEVFHPPKMSCSPKHFVFSCRDVEAAHGIEYNAFPLMMMSKNSSAANNRTVNQFKRSSHVLDDMYYYKSTPPPNIVFSSNNPTSISTNVGSSMINEGAHTIPSINSIQVCSTENTPEQPTGCCKKISLSKPNKRSTYTSVETFNGQTTMISNENIGDKVGRSSKEKVNSQDHILKSITSKFLSNPIHQTPANTNASNSSKHIAGFQYKVNNADLDNSKGNFQMTEVPLQQKIDSPSRSKTPSAGPKEVLVDRTNNTNEEKLSCAAKIHPETSVASSVNNVNQTKTPRNNNINNRSQVKSSRANSISRSYSDNRDHQNSRENRVGADDRREDCTRRRPSHQISYQRAERFLSQYDVFSDWEYIPPMPRQSSSLPPRNPPDHIRSQLPDSPRHCRTMSGTDDAEDDDYDDGNDDEDDGINVIIRNFQTMSHCSKTD